ncbi:MBL fold metallo-hydrolase [bacterium]|nr:MBL fold metallo-hydrolase [bacterium]MBT3730101.1 MBL fold metallo-hydrolase [bacterium]MBT4894686.1 MBL fold metallo-hydrolase [bacterium]
MKDQNKLKLTFHGGTGSVTGANFLLEGEGKRILVDCGLFQGGDFAEDQNKKPFPYDPASIDILFITHAHLDHIGRIPKLVKEGFKGVIYSTPATMEITEISLVDSMGVLAKEAKRKGIEPLYDREDVKRTMALWKSIKYKEQIDISDNLKAVFKDAGHILGSAIIEFKHNGRKVVFTGDLGNSPAPLLRDTEVVKDADFMVIESVYGDRNHEAVEERTQRLRDAIESTINKGGALLIPAFSIERTQVLLYEINNLVEGGKIPKVPVFLDSPLAIKVTKVYQDRIQNFNKGVKDEIAGGDDIFKFPLLEFTEHHQESINIADTPNPKIIIAGSGMSNGGRIIHHEKRHLPDPNSTLLIVGYQAAGSLGRKLVDGAKEVDIMGQRVQVRAQVINLTGYSAHKDSDGLIEFVDDSAETLKKVFVVMGEQKSALFLVQRLRDYVGVNAIAPKLGESFEL